MAKDNLVPNCDTFPYTVRDIYVKWVKQYQIKCKYENLTLNYNDILKYEKMWLLTNCDLYTMKMDSLPSNRECIQGIDEMSRFKLYYALPVVRTVTRIMRWLPALRALMPTSTRNTQ